VEGFELGKWIAFSLMPTPDFASDWNETLNRRLTACDEHRKSRRKELEWHQGFKSTQNPWKATGTEADARMTCALLVRPCRDVEEVRTSVKM